MATGKNSGKQLKRLWEAKGVGRPRAYKDGAALWKACCEYFLWVEENPLWEVKAFAWQGDVEQVRLPKMRAMTIGGLCAFLDVTREAWRAWKTEEPYSEVTQMVEQIIYEQKFTGAAADLFNASIISRDLGLAEKTDVNHRSEDGTMTPTRITRVIVRPGDVPDSAASDNQEG